MLRGTEGDAVELGGGGVVWPFPTQITEISERCPKVADHYHIWMLPKFIVQLTHSSAILQDT
jgi:hypothetical protein